MNKAEKIIKLTRLIDENILELEKLNKEKIVLKTEYSKDPKNIETLNKINALEKKYAILYKNSNDLNLQIKKLTENN